MVEVPATPRPLLRVSAKAFEPLLAPAVKVWALMVPSTVMAPVCSALPRVKVAKATDEPTLPARLIKPPLLAKVSDSVLAVLP